MEEDPGETPTIDIDIDIDTLTGIDGQDETHRNYTKDLIEDLIKAIIELQQYMDKSNQQQKLLLTKQLQKHYRLLSAQTSQLRRLNESLKPITLQ